VFERETKYEILKKTPPPPSGYPSPPHTYTMVQYSHLGMYALQYECIVLCITQYDIMGGDGVTKGSEKFDKPNT
jgi:hypothetical protein